MPKKSKSKKLPPFAHPTKHGKLHWKKVLLIVLTGAFGLVLAAAITAQVLYNRFVWDRLNENSSLKITLLIQSALEGLDELKKNPVTAADGSQFIQEAKLKLPPENDNVNKLLYFYQAAETGSDGTGYNWDIPEQIQITTKQISGSARQRLLAMNTIDEVFKIVPEAQACNRGFLLRFEEDTENSSNESGRVKLNDGRTLYVYREPDCSYQTDMIGALEAYLLQAQSY